MIFKELLNIELEKSREEFKSIQRKISAINQWNKEHIWQYGRTKTPDQILNDTLGEPFDPAVYLEYLENKCKDIYGI